MISSFIVVFLIGIFCVKYCFLSQSFRTFAEEVRRIRRATATLNHSHESDNWSGGSESGGSNSSFALADMTNLYATTIGVIFVLTAIVNLARTPDFEKPKRAENRLNMTNMTDMSFTSYRSNKSMVSDGTKAI